MERINALIELLGETRVQKLKDEIVEVLIEKLRDDFDSWHEYVFYPPDYSEILEQAVKKAEKKIEKIYVDKLVEQGIKALKVDNGNEN